MQGRNIFSLAFKFWDSDFACMSEGYHKLSLPLSYFNNQLVPNLRR